jgi:hypothetical protein
MVSTLVWRRSATWAATRRDFSAIGDTVNLVSGFKRMPRSDHCQRRHVPGLPDPLSDPANGILVLDASIQVKDAARQLDYEIGAPALIFGCAHERNTMLTANLTAPLTRHAPWPTTHDLQLCCAPARYAAPAAWSAAKVFEQLYFVRTDLDTLVERFSGESTELAQLRALAQTMKLVNSSLDLDYVLNEVMDTVIALTGAERGYLMLRSEQTGEMQFRVARDLNRQTLAESKFTVSKTIVTKVAQTGEPVVAKDAVTDANYSSQDSIIMHMPRSILCVPLIYHDQTHRRGLCRQPAHADLFGEKELALLVAFANQAAVAIENARCLSASDARFESPRSRN